MLAALAGVGGYIFWALNGGLVRDGNWVGVDFHVYYQAAQALRRGEDIYSASISPPYVYPPTLAVLVAPLSFLPANTATMLWKLAQHVCLLISGGLLVSLVPPRARAMLAAIFCLGLLTAPVHDEIMTGESNSLVLVLVVAAVWLVSRQEK
ncbi:MAG TPA: glycosyltransferase 87 family protein, partial [Chloroflexia bacterium]|nr:glycosyltransferase 87 family protein [Chloroflexia bacterium]